MSGCIFILGKMDKKLLFPLVYLIIYVFINIFDREKHTTIAAAYIENFGRSLSNIIVFFVSIVVKYTFKRKLSQKSEKKHYLKDFGILLLISAFQQFTDFLPYIFDKLNKVKDETNDDNSKELLVNGALELIIITLTTFFALKYKYYIHHIICIVIIVVICIALDFLFLNWYQTNRSTIISSISLILSEIIIYSYFKYLIEFKYYFYLDILYIYGIFCFFLNSIALGINVLVNKLDGTNHIFFEFYNYYNTYGIGIVVYRFIRGLIIIGFIIDILEFIILDKMSPIYIFICYEMGKIPANIIDFVSNDYQIRGEFKVLILIAILILSLLQIITLLFYLEIFECNFCSLNKNTKKNIEERERMLAVDDIGVKNDDVDNESDIEIIVRQKHSFKLLI